MIITTTIIGHGHGTRPLSTYYKVQETDKDYICSLAKDNGMHSCGALPHMKRDGRMCNASAAAAAAALVAGGASPWTPGGDCVNWNQYYTNCRAGEKNPFQGAISFDNIGLAWVAIFLVLLISSDFLSIFTSFYFILITHLIVN